MARLHLVQKSPCSRSSWTLVVRMKMAESECAALTCLPWPEQVCPALVWNWGRPQAANTGQINNSQNVHVLLHKGTEQCLCWQFFWVPVRPQAEGACETSALFKGKALLGLGYSPLKHPAFPGAYPIHSGTPTFTRTLPKAVCAFTPGHLLRQLPP